MEYLYNVLDRIRLQRGTENALVVLVQARDSWIVDIIQPGSVRTLRRKRYAAAWSLFRAELRRCTEQGWEEINTGSDSPAPKGGINEYETSKKSN